MGTKGIVVDRSRIRILSNMDMDRSSNGEYKYQRDDDADDKPRSLDESEEKDHQVDKAGEYMHELLQEKIDLDGQKWPNAIRLLDQGESNKYSLNRFFSNNLLEDESIIRNGKSPECPCTTVFILATKLD